MSYYPPRSRWHTRALYSLARPFRRVFDLDALQQTAPLSLGGVILAFALPGFTFFALGRRLFGWLCLAGYALALGLFVVRLGYPESGVAYGLLISLHASSLIYLEHRWMQSSTFAARLGLGLCTLFAVWALLYAPLAGYVQRNWFLPMRFLDNKVWVVHPNVDLRSLRRGDFVLHRIPGSRERGLILEEGWGIDPVLGLPGDHLKFTKASVVVNGKLFPRAAYMPLNEEITVPQNVWFIWPDLSISLRGAARVDAAVPMLRETALVTSGQIIGRPYKTWFGRRQWP